MRSNIEIRSLEISHLRTVFEMGRESIEPQSLASFDWSPELLAKAYSKNEFLQLGAFIKKKLIGYLIALQLEKDGAVKILGLGINKDFRDKVSSKKNSELIGEVELQLLTRLVELLDGVNNVVVAVPANDEYLFSIFEKIGFVKSQSFVEMKLP